MVMISAVGIAVAVAAGAWAVLTRLDERNSVRAALRQLDDHATGADDRDRELLNPLKERALQPLVQGFTGLGRRFTPAGYVDKVRAKFMLLGTGTTQTVDRFLAIRVVTVIAAALVFLFVIVFNITPLTGNLRLAFGGLLILACLLGPDAVLNRKVEERQHAIQVGLPDVLDLLVISVEAGLGFEQALDRVIASVPGPLTEEFARMLGETRAGASRADAMRAMDERCDVPELRAFVLSIIQADTFGVSIGRVLRAQSEEMRIKRRQAAEERAQKAPVKMLIPMVFCIFPALFAVVLGPAILQIRESF
ncbi:MAG: type II secretion system F family protein [Actinomycetes bacterium]